MSAPPPRWWTSSPRSMPSRFWQQFELRSLEQWVSLRCSVSFAHAKRLVAMARALGPLPLLREKFAARAVSEDQMVEVAKARVAPVHDREAADFASVMSVAQLRKALSFLPDVPEPTRTGDGVPHGRAQKPDRTPDDEPATEGAKRP